MTTQSNNRFLGLTPCASKKWLSYITNLFNNPSADTLAAENRKLKKQVAFLRKQLILVQQQYNKTNQAKSAFQQTFNLFLERLSAFQLDYHQQLTSLALDIFQIEQEV
jgi:hypothetical protein